MTDKPILSTAIVDALAAWSNVEFALARLFSILADMQDVSDPKMNRKAYAIFDAVISFDTRTDIVNALMTEEGVTELEMETWRKVLTRLRKLHKRRHAIAHFALSGTPPPEGDPSDHSKWDYGILPFFTVTSALKNGFDRLPFEQILERRSHFDEMAGAIHYYISWASQRRGQQPDIPTPELPLILRLQLLASQNL